MSAEQRASRREVLAFVALQDLPTPTTISFYSETGVSLSFESLAIGRAWSQVFGGLVGAVVAKDGTVWLEEGAITWRGWRVQLSASDPPPPQVEDLPEETQSKLRHITGGDR